MRSLRTLTRDLLNGSTRQETIGHNIKTGVEFVFSLSSASYEILLTIALVYLVNPIQDPSISIGLIHFEGTNLSQLSLVIIISYILVRWHFKVNHHCQYPGDD